jgi:BolA protein
MAAFPANFKKDAAASSPNSAQSLKYSFRSRGRTPDLARRSASVYPRRKTAETNMRMQDRIEARLAEALAPAEMAITDESSLHAGHSGARAGGETHYRVNIVSPHFTGKSRVQRHRLVYEALTAELADGVHALALATRAPGEA